MRILHHGSEHCFLYHLIRSLYLGNISMAPLRTGIRNPPRGLGCLFIPQIACRNSRSGKIWRRLGVMGGTEKRNRGRLSINQVYD